MSYNTRFNPSANGAGLHLGHVYMALINEAVAHQSGGKFIVRHDDSNQEHERVFGRARMDRARAQQREELEWLGLPVDEWITQTEILPQVHVELVRRDWVFPFNTYPIVTAQLPCDERTALFPYEPLSTAEKVIMDWMEGINLLIRGLDLLSEYALYMHLCRLGKLPEPAHLYLPRLGSPHGVMSKTHGGVWVADLRAKGYSPADVRLMLAEACLREPGNPWALWNLKSEPRLQ